MKAVLHMANKNRKRSAMVMLRRNRSRRQSVIQLLVPISIFPDKP